jgi:thiamine biosynthesis lipoprotein
MGSTAEVLVWGPAAPALLAWAFDELARLEACWSRFDPASELSRLNAAPGTGPHPVSPTLLLALVRAEQAWRETAGRFDATVLESLETLGYDRTFREVRDRVAPHREAVPVPGFATVALDAHAGSVRRPQGVRIDLGGIGKGLAADVVVDGLVARGATSVCVSVGGDLRVGGPGPHDDDAWLVPVEDPTGRRAPFHFPLVDEALAQSSTVVRRWRRGTGDAHHLIDPHDGECAASGVTAAIVTDRACWRAEALAKAALVAGPVAGLALLRSSGVDGWLLLDDGAVLTTPDVAAITWAPALHRAPSGPPVAGRRGAPAPAPNHPKAERVLAPVRDV